MDEALKRLLVSVLIILSGSTVSAGEALELSQALSLATQRSGKLAGAAAAVAQNEAMVKANQGLGGPVVDLSTTAYSFDRTQGLNLGSVNMVLAGIHLPIPLPTLPDSVAVRLRKSGTNASLNVLWPLYTGGRIEGVKDLLSGRATEAMATELQERDEVQSTLLQRYFGVQAAVQVLRVREAARSAIAEHLASARRMEQAGLIARVERLRADVAYEGAIREASKARHELALARRALAAMVGDMAEVLPPGLSVVPASAPVSEDESVVLATPLFVNTRPLEPLASYLARGQSGHPSLAVIASKRQQTLAMNKVEDSVRLPSVMAFGRADPANGHANWIAGVSINWVLYEGIDRSAVLHAGHEAERRVDEIERQARQDISLLVERNYRNLDQAKVRFLSLRADDELAREVLRLRQKGLQEGVSTTIDLIDEQVNLAKVQAEQAGAAYDYSQALAALLSAVGELDNFAQRATSADIVLR